MYDVMIIDDDQSIHERLKSIIEWDDIGIRLVCEAQDGDTARELFLLYRPKIIITDIQIPIISGLELAKEISAIDPQVRFIVITGYTDFEYAKTSIRLGAVDLLSKPILPTKINASLKKSVDYFEKLRSEHISSYNMKLLLKESLPIFQIKFASYLLGRDRSYTAEEIFDKFKRLNLDITGSYYTIALISPNINELSTADTDLALVATRNTCNVQLSNAGYKVYSFYDNDYRLNCLISWNFDNGSEKLEETLLNIIEKMEFYWNLKVFSGFGMPTTDITKLHNTHHEAYIALNYQGVLASGPVINYQNINRFDKPMLSEKSNVIPHAVMCLKNNDLDKMSELIQNEITNIFSSTKNYIQPTRKLIFEFTSSIIAECISLGIDTDTISKYSEIYSNIFSSENMQSLMQYMLEFAENISKELILKRSDSKNMLIRMAKDFIQNNLGDKDLDLDMVSNNIGLSSIYFCKLFHKEEGVSFNTYLNVKRVKKAKNLLSETNLKVFEIAYATGYGNPKYFNYVFKRIAGVTPLEYRNSSK